MSLLVAQPKTIELALKAAKATRDVNGEVHHPNKRLIDAINHVKETGRPCL